MFVSVSVCTSITETRLLFATCITGVARVLYMMCVLCLRMYAIYMIVYRFIYATMHASVCTSVSSCTMRELKVNCVRPAIVAEWAWQILARVMKNRKALLHD